MEIIIVTGLSGAGKSGAIDCFEDMGYYCIDNLPPSLIKNMIELVQQSKKKQNKMVFVIDIRGGEFFSDLTNSLEELREAGFEYKILFLEASNEALLRRFSETRRIHPLATTGGTNLEGIEEERKTLLPIKKIADYVIDTSDTKPMQLTEEIRDIFISDKVKSEMSIKIRSFGFKHGLPKEADMMFDMRFIPNPFYVEGLKELTGMNSEVREFVMSAPESQFFKETVLKLINELIPSYMREGKYNLNIAFGCTGGQHRSVTMANEIYEELRKQGKDVNLVHRDL